MPTKMSQLQINSQITKSSTASQMTQQPAVSQMSQRPTTSQASPPNFALEGITVQVSSARDTHQFLCEVFAQPNTFINWEPEAGKGRLPQLTQDGMHTDFFMSNTAIRFSKDTANNTVRQNKMTFRVQVQDVVHIKQVLDRHTWRYKHGKEATPEHTRWIRFLDLDGNTWHVSELKSN